MSWGIGARGRKADILIGHDGRRSDSYLPANLRSLGAFGPHLAHDGGGILGPQWERYGDTPNRPLEAGQVYTVELGLMLLGYGDIGLEEDVLVTEQGATYLGQPQSRLILR